MRKNVLLFFHHHKILIRNHSFGSIYDTVNFNAQFAALLKRKDEKTLPMCPVGIELQSQLQSHRNKIDLKLKLHDCNHIIIPCFNHLYSCVSFLSFSLSFFLSFLAPSLRFILSVCGSSLYPIPRLVRPLSCAPIHRCGWRHCDTTITAGLVGCKAAGAGRFQLFERYTKGPASRRHYTNGRSVLQARRLAER